ncbi:hypothetical protein OQA88_4545 [Cercophora sp. LCS_1]
MEVAPAAFVRRVGEDADGADRARKKQIHHVHTQSLVASRQDLGNVGARPTGLLSVSSDTAKSDVDAMKGNQKGEHAVSQEALELLADNALRSGLSKGPSTAPDDLTYRPIVLQTWFLGLIIAFNVSIMSLLVALCFKPKFDLLNEWAYFVLQIFPTIIGTVTFASLEAITTALSRITPFMRCARPGGDVAATSVLMQYIPMLSFADSAASRNWNLFCANVILWLGFPVLGLKAALLSASIETGVAEVTHWTLYALLAAYAIITLYVSWVVFYLRNRVTGLRKEWDTVNIADHLVLFRHSNFLDSFEGSCIATRKSILARLGSMQLKLQYWTQDDGQFWYGFNQMPRGVEEENPDTVVEAPDRSQDPQLSSEQLSRIRFKSVFTAMKRLPRVFFTTTAVLILIGYITALVLGSRQQTGNIFEMNISPGLSAFAFNFLLTSVLSLFSLFWEDVYLFTSITEPFVEMGKPGGATADEALLLKYTSTPRLIAIYDAAGRGHWKVVRTASFAMLQRLLPIIAGASVSVSSHNSDTTASMIQFSTPLSIITMAYLAAYSILIPYEDFESGYTRHLPRDSLSIGDLLSWTCSSDLLRKDAITSDGYESNPDTGLLAGNPFDTKATGPQSERWNMEARLRLAQLRFSFGLARVSSGGDAYTVGIKTDDDVPHLHRPMRGLRKRVARVKDEEKDAEVAEEKYRISGASKFAVADASEQNADAAGTGGPIAAENAVRQTGQEEE